MTPQEFFDKAINEDSRFVLAKLIQKVRVECNGALLQYFIEDVKGIADKWRECERVKKWEEDDNGYLDEYNRLNMFYMSYGMPHDVYDIKAKEIELKRPLPLDFYFAPPLPYNFQWTLEKLKNGIGNLNPTPLPDTSTGATGTAPEWWERYPELDTPEARLYVSRAIERGFIKQTSTGFEWIPIMGRGGKAQLGYFLSMIYQRPRPINTLERLFDVKKLSTYLSNADYEAKRADVIRWRTEIDKIFAY